MFNIIYVIHIFCREQYPGSVKYPDIEAVKYRKTWQKRYGMSNKTAQKHTVSTYIGIFHDKNNISLIQRLKYRPERFCPLVNYTRCIKF